MNNLKRLNFLVARCLLVFARCFLFSTFCSLRSARCLSLSARCVLLFARYIIWFSRNFGSSIRSLRVLLIHRVYDHTVYHDLLHTYFIGDTCFGAAKCMFITSNKLLSVQLMCWIFIRKLHIFGCKERKKVFPSNLCSIYLL